MVYKIIMLKVTFSISGSVIHHELKTQNRTNHFFMFTYINSLTHHGVTWVDHSIVDYLLDDGNDAEHPNIPLETMPYSKMGYLFKFQIISTATYNIAWLLREGYVNTILPIKTLLPVLNLLFCILKLSNSGDKMLM